MAKQQRSFKTEKAKVWVVKGVEFTSKSAAYRYCRTVNGKKVGGKRQFKVERKNA